MGRQFKPGQLQTGSLYNISASYAVTASFALNGGGGGGTTINTGSFVTTSSFNAFTASYATGSFTGSFIGDGSQLTGIVSSKWTGSNPISRQSDVEITGSLRVQGSITGSLFGTASWSTNAVTASYVNPLNQNVQLTGSLYLSTPEVASVYFSGSAAASRLVWNDTDGTLDLGLKGGNVTLQIGQESVIQVVNKTGANLLESEYKAVRIRRVDEGGAHGQRLAIVLAQADNDANSVDTLGLVTENINVNQEGFITNTGLVRNINTTGASQGESWVDGDVLYLSPTTPGAITKVKPQGPQHTVILGYVVYAHSNNGKIFVKVDNGYEIDELHNVKITTGSLTAGQLLVRSGSNATGVWINTNQLTGSYGLTGSLTATSFTGSLQGTASWASNAVTASYVQTAQTASYVLQAVSSSFATSASYAPDTTFPYTGSARITGSLGVTGSVSVLATTATTSTIFNVRNSANTLDIIKANGRGDAFIGQGAGRLTTGVSNTFMGLNAGSNNITGQENTAIGANAGQQSLGSYNTYLGNGAGLNGTTTEGSIFIGYSAGQNSNANYAVLIGYTAGTTAGAGSVAIGYNAGPGTGTHNLSIGQSAGVGMTTGAINMHLGYRTVGSGVTTGNYNTLIGGDIVVGNVSNNAVLADMQGNIAIRKNASHLVGIGYGGTDTLGAKLDVKAQGALSTDIAFRVRNSANDANILSVNGDGTQTWFRPANNALSTIKSDTYNLIQWSNEAFGNIAIGYITGSSNLFTPTAGYNTLIGAGNVVSSSISGVVRVGYAGSTSANYAINIGHGGRSIGVNSIRIGFHTGASQFGGTNSIHMGTTPSGNDILADNVFMTYFNSQNPSTLARVNGSFGLLGQQSTILSNGVGLYGVDTHMGNGGNTLVIATHPSPPSSSITTAFQLYASTGSIASNIRPHFRTSNGTIVWLGDESRLFNVTASNMMVGVTSSLALFTSQNITANIGTTTIYAFPTASYEGAFIDYTARSGSNARAGQIMGIRSGSAVNFTETTTTDFGSTSGLTFGMSISASSMIVSASATTAAWSVKTIIRSM